VLSQRLRTFSGYVSDGPSLLRGSLYFSLGHPPHSFEMPAYFVGSPFNANEFIVVAALPSVMPGVNSIALACRRVAVSNSVYGASIAFPVIGLLLAIEVVALAPTSVYPLASTLLFAFAGVCLGVLSVRRLLAIRLAKRVVLEWVAP